MSAYSTPPRQQSPRNLVWMDLEMTGLDPSVDVILQAALIITDAELNVLEEYVADVYQPPEALAVMVPFVRKMHEKTGLLARLSAGKEQRRVEQELLERISGWCPFRPILCGNTIHSDRKFIDRWMPAIAGYLHYRMVDVSSLKVLAGLWSPTELHYQKPDHGQHDALFDVRQSVLELAHYRRVLFRNDGAGPLSP